MKYCKLSGGYSPYYLFYYYITLVNHILRFFIFSTSDIFLQISKVKGNDLKEYYCSACAHTSKVALEVLYHVTGKEHEKTVLKRFLCNLMYALYCPFCKLILSDEVVLVNHIYSTQHASVVQSLLEKKKTAKK